MKKKIAITTGIAVALTAITLFFTSTGGADVPMGQFAMYRPQTVSYENFTAGIFAQGQMGEATKLPSGSEVVFYVDANRINGPSGLQTGARCTETQAVASYNQDTITMDKRFCPDINDAILDKTPFEDATPTESVFLHKVNGERCFVTNGSFSEYLINPGDYFYRDYLSRRIEEKLDYFSKQAGTFGTENEYNVVFLDDLRPSWSSITSACNGVPQEYSLPVEYNSALRDMAEFVYLNIASRVYGNLAVAGSHWAEFSFLDGVMCESCFTNWGAAYPSASKMMTDLEIISKWSADGKSLYVAAIPPTRTEADARFIFSASLLAPSNGKTWFHFGDSGTFVSIPEYKYKLGAPLEAYSCAGSVCIRRFEHGTVTVDFSTRTGTVTMELIPTVTPVPTSTNTPIPTPIPSPTVTPICVLVYPDKAELCP